MTGLYVDSSAALKRVVIERESEDVVRILERRDAEGELVASSSLTWVEVARAVIRAGADDVNERLATAMAGIAELPLDDTVLDRARTIGPPILRSLDAIHVASAVALGANELLTYDERLAAAARAVGIRAIA